MFDSGVTANDFINALKSEADIAPDIPDSYYIDWINGVEQALYDNVVREEAHAMTENAYTISSGSGYIVCDVSIEDDFVIETESGDVVRFEDITFVEALNRRCTKVSLKVGELMLFPFSYWKDSNKLMVAVPQSSSPTSTYITIGYKVRPVPKTTANISTVHIMVPPEYLDMVRAKLRGEAYKFANEDALAAKWLNDYNQQLEYFRAWIASKSPTFGV